jgi:hypothetical protein
MNGFKQMSRALATAGLLTSGMAHAALNDQGGNLRCNDVLDVSARGEVAVDSEAEGAPNPWKVGSTELVVLTSADGCVFNMDREQIETRVRITCGRDLEEHHGVFRLVAVSREKLEALLAGTELPVQAFAVAMASPKREIKTAGAPTHLGA